MLEKDMSNSHGINEDFSSSQGEEGELLVREKIRLALDKKEFLCYAKFPIFGRNNQERKEIDILVIEQKLGIIIIEVKGLKIDNVTDIDGHNWHYQNFYVNQGNPYLQGEKQLFSLLKYWVNEPSLHGKVTARVLVALPFIYEREWDSKGFSNLPSNPPLIFADDLINLTLLKHKLENTSPVVKGNILHQQQWQLLLTTITGKSVITPPSYRVLTSDDSKGKILQQWKDYFYKLDLSQDKYVREKPKGIEGIKGLAGGGKTVMLCQKVAYLYLQNPQSKIAFIFFSRSLYGQIIGLIDRWLRFYSNNQVTYNHCGKNLMVLHGWGGKNQRGFYSLICRKVKALQLRVSDTNNQSPNEALAEACYQLLNDYKIPPLFDYIFIDEAQDFLSDKWQWQGKQAFFALVYHSLISEYQDNKKLIKNLVYAYDEIQCLQSSLTINPRGLFQEFLIDNSQQENIYIISESVRSHPKILNTALAMAMGWLRPLGILSIITDSKTWEEMGYKLTGKIAEGETFSLTRIKSDFTHPLSKGENQEIIKFKTFYSRQEELNYVANNILINLRQDGLRPSQQILVIILGNSYYSQKIQHQCKEMFEKKAIEVYFPQEGNKNEFWQNGAVTVSGIYQAKGNEADMVYVVGLDQIAKEESNISLRNQIFVALTRSRGWVNISGVGEYVMYSELKKIMEKEDEFTITLRDFPKKVVRLSEKEDLIKRFALGDRNFAKISISSLDFTGIYFDNINLIGSNLRGINFRQVSLQKAKFISGNLTDINFHQANLREAKFVSATLENVDFSYADLTGVDFSHAIFKNINFEGANLDDTIFPEQF